MKKVKFERRCGLERREFYYTEYTPERRSGKDRRIDKNGKRIIWIKATNRVIDYIKARLPVYLPGNSCKAKIIYICQCVICIKPHVSFRQRFFC
jgi:hypothetical protein